MKKLLTKLLACALLCASIAGMGACSSLSDDLEVYAPDGAPALSLLCGIQAEDKKEDSVFDFEVVDASTIQTYVTGKNPEADFCILPVNLAAKLLGTGETYQMLGTVTHGNLYFLTCGDGETIVPNNLKDALTGKKVGVVQLPNVPGLTLKAVLHKYGAEYTTLESAQAEADPAKVNLVAFAPENVTPNGGCDYYLVPEPAATTKINATQSAPKPFRMAGDLQMLYGELVGYPQAVAVARKSVIETRSDDVQTFISYLTQAKLYLQTASTETVLHLLEEVREGELKPTFSAANLTKTVIENCSVGYIPSKDCKAEVIGFLDALLAVSEDSAAKPQDAFFYLQ